LIAVALLGGLAGCGADAPLPPSPGVKLVQNATASGLPTIAEFGAATCASCREMKVVLDRVAQSTQGRAHVLVMDISKDWEAAQMFRIQLMFLYSIGHGALLLAAGSSVGFAQWVARSHWAGRVNWLFTRLAGALLIGYALYLTAEMAG